MVRVLTKISSLLLAVIFISASLGFNVKTHYCGDSLYKQSLSFSSSELTCGMENFRGLNCESSISNNCCNNEVQTFKVEDDYETTTFELNQNSAFIIAFASAYLDISSSAFNDNLEYIAYSPPILKRDIPVLVQSFLI